MSQARHLLPDMADVETLTARWQLLLYAGIGKNRAPGIDHHGVAMALAPSVMQAGLGEGAST